MWPVVWAECCVVQQLEALCGLCRPLCRERYSVFRGSQARGEQQHRAMHVSRALSFSSPLPPSHPSTSVPLYRCCCVHRAGTASPLFLVLLRRLSFILSLRPPLRPRPVTPLGQRFFIPDCPLTPADHRASHLDDDDVTSPDPALEPVAIPSEPAWLQLVPRRTAFIPFTHFRPSALPTIGWCLFTDSSRQRFYLARL